MSLEVADSLGDIIVGEIFSYLQTVLPDKAEGILFQPLSFSHYSRRICAVIFQLCSSVSVSSMPDAAVTIIFYVSRSQNRLDDSQLCMRFCEEEAGFAEEMEMLIIHWSGYGSHVSIVSHRVIQFITRDHDD